MKWFEALVLIIYMTHNALLPGQVTHRSHLLFPKTRLCLLSMAIMTKLVFWPILALNHSQIDPRMGLAAFVGLSSCDIHDKQCTASMSSNSWGLFTLLENSTFLLSMTKMEELGYGLFLNNCSVDFFCFWLNL